MLESFAPYVGAACRFALPLVILCLAMHFGRTLRRGETPLIEQIAALGKPALSPELRRYTRRLTGLWFVYLASAAVVTGAGSAVAPGMAVVSSLAVSCATALLFVGERCARPLLFPGETFPGLAQQVRDTLTIMRMRNGQARCSDERA